MYLYISAVCIIYVTKSQPVQSLCKYCSISSHVSFSFKVVCNTRSIHQLLIMKCGNYIFNLATCWLMFVYTIVPYVVIYIIWIPPWIHPYIVLFAYEHSHWLQQIYLSHVVTPKASLSSVRIVNTNTTFVTLHNLPYHLYFFFSIHNGLSLTKYNSVPHFKISKRSFYTMAC